jgi:Chromo (CHRromatin Organisation MOdifier) domain
LFTFEQLFYIHRSLVYLLSRLSQQTLKPYFPDATGHRIPKTPEPVVVNGQIEYLVETILDSRKVRNKTQYLVKWKGYPIYESTWEPEENVQGSEAIEDF